MELYAEAAQILTRVCQKEGTVKTLVYSSTYKNLKQLFALVSECIKYQPILEEVLAQCDPSLLEDQLIDYDESLAVVLLYEFLIGKGFGHAGFIRKAIVKHKAQLKSAYRAALENHGSFQGALQERQESSSKIPRYARVNLASFTISEVIKQLKTEGWIYNGTLQIESFHEEIASLGESNFGLDPLMDDVLVFSPGTDLHNHPLVMSGGLVLQDKASCVPAHTLDPQPGSVVLDCCAAPGNKTCHLASLMGDKGHVIALDRDLKRITTMKKLLDRSGFTCIDPIHQDFLTISPTNEDASKIDKILVDPSCSGSGMAGARVSPSDDHVDCVRLERLKRFQISILKHALRFPNVQRVVYSTCSIHRQENEEVVEEVMEHVTEYFQFKPVYPELTNSRGLKNFRHHKNFLRLSPEKDLTLGFFVACFDRIKSAEKPSVDGQSDDCDAVSSEKMGEEQEAREGQSRDNEIETVDDKNKEGKRRKRLKENHHDKTLLSPEENVEHASSSIVSEDRESERVNSDGEIQRSKRERKKKKKFDRFGEHQTESELMSDSVSESVNSKAPKKSKSRHIEEETFCQNVSVNSDIPEGDIDIVLKNKQAKKNKKRKKSEGKEENYSQEISIGNGDHEFQSCDLLQENGEDDPASFSSPKKKMKKMKKEKRKKEEKERRHSSELLVTSKKCKKER